MDKKNLLKIDSFDSLINQHPKSVLLLIRGRVYDVTEFLDKVEQLYLYIIDQLE